MAAPGLSRLVRLAWPVQIKRMLPRSLFGRSLLIIILPIALMQVAVTWASASATPAPGRK